MSNEKIRNAVVKMLIGLNNDHNLSDGEIHTIALLMSALINSDKELRTIFYKESQFAVGKIKEKLKEREQKILGTIDEDEREIFKKEAMELAAKKKTVVN